MAVTRNDYETVAVSQTDQVMGGGAGAIGDILEQLVITIATAATGTVSIKDGAGAAIPICAANTPIGVYTVILQIRSLSGGWKITTGAGATVVATGRFST